MADSDDEFRSPGPPVPDPGDRVPRSLSEDMFWFGLVPGLIIHRLRHRRSQEPGDPDALDLLSELDGDELAELEEDLGGLLAKMGAPGDDPAFRAGYECHVRLMRWMTEQGDRGQAIRHALDARDTDALLEYLTQPVADVPIGFLLGFQAANGELAARFEEKLPRSVQA